MQWPEVVFALYHVFDILKCHKSLFILLLYFIDAFFGESSTSTICSNFCDSENEHFLVFRWAPCKGFIGEDCDHFFCWLKRGDTNQKRASSLWISGHGITRWRSSTGLISTTSWAGHPILPDRKWREVQENPIWPLTGELTLSRQMRACLPRPERWCKVSWAQTWVKNINMSSSMPCKFSWVFTGSDSSFRISPGRGCADIF